MQPNNIHIIKIKEYSILPGVYSKLTIKSEENKEIVLRSFQNQRLVGLIIPDNKDLTEKVGILVKIFQFKEIVLDSRESVFELNIEGLMRFKLKELSTDSLEKSNVSYQGFLSDRDYPPLSIVKRNKLIYAAMRHLVIQEKEFDVSIFDNLSDKLVVDIISMVSDFTPYQRQIILEAVDYNDRYSLLMEIFYMDYPIPQGFDEGLNLSV